MADVSLATELALATFLCIFEWSLVTSTSFRTVVTKFAASLRTVLASLTTFLACLMTPFMASLTWGFFRSTFFNPAIGRRSLVIFDMSLPCCSFFRGFLLNNPSSNFENTPEPQVCPVVWCLAGEACPLPEKSSLGWSDFLSVFLCVSWCLEKSVLFEATLTSFGSLKLVLYSGHCPFILNLGCLTLTVAKIGLFIASISALSLSTCQSCLEAAFTLDSGNL